MKQYVCAKWTANAEGIIISTVDNNVGWVAQMCQIPKIVFSNVKSHFSVIELIWTTHVVTEKKQQKGCVGSMIIKNILKKKKRKKKELKYYISITNNY